MLTVVLAGRARNEIIGAFLLELLVFVLGRRATW